MLQLKIKEAWWDTYLNYFAKSWKLRVGYQGIGEDTKKSVNGTDGSETTEAADQYTKCPVLCWFIFTKAQGGLKLKNIEDLPKVPK